MPSINEIIIAAAGSGKTSRLVEEALSSKDERVLIITYTRENLAEINSRVWARAGGRSGNISMMTWFEFMLRDGIKPYQSYITDILSIRSINFVSENPPYSNRSDFSKYYFDTNSNVYSDAVSDLACVLNDKSGGKVIKRLEDIYDVILVDEMQDFAGWDLEFAELLLNSRIRVLMVGDPRQAVYSTNRSTKNRQFRGSKIVNWIEKRVQANQCRLSTTTSCHRSNQQICDYADAIYPQLPSTVSKNHNVVRSMGVHLVHIDHLDEYRASIKPQELRWNKLERNAGLGALNLGEVKGMTFERVIIHPTSTMIDYIESGNEMQPITRARFYVGLTRACHSVGIVIGYSNSKSSLPYWSPEPLPNRKFPMM